MRFTISFQDLLKKTWLAPEDTVFERVSLLAASGEAAALVALMLRKYITQIYTF
ncbi:MAG: hypothetical protein HGJ98_16050 [Desulfosporosinus sp.]|nr:hypothetical protein [Desulfosporosinus sp.]